MKTAPKPELECIPPPKWHPYVYEVRGVIYITPCRGKVLIAGSRHWPRKMTEPNFIQRWFGVTLQQKMRTVYARCEQWCERENERERRAMEFLKRKEWRHSTP